MSSNIQIQKICELCGTEFTARTTVTRFCSHKCSSRAHKERIRQQKIQKSNAETVKIKNKEVDTIKAKEYLTVSEVAVLIGCSRRTTYRLVSNGTINATNLGERLSSNFKPRSKFFDTRDLLCIACYTGLRISDVLTLKWKNIQGNVIVTKMMKTGKEVTIPIGDRPKYVLDFRRKILDRHGIEIHPEKYVFNILNVNHEKDNREEVFKAMICH